MSRSEQHECGPRVWRVAFPSYLKLLCTAAVIGLAAAYPVKLVSIDFSKVLWPWSARAADPTAVPYRLFDEYLPAAADLAADPAGTRQAVWVSLLHLPPSDRAVYHDRWRVAHGVKAVDAAGDVFRLTCSGQLAAEFEAATADYPYAIAPGVRVEPDLKSAYWTVATASSFRTPVVNGDWLLATAADRPALAAALGLTVPAEGRPRYAEAVVPREAVFALFPPDTHGRLDRVPPSGITRRALERDDGNGSPFVRWTTAAEVGVPVR